MRILILLTVAILSCAVFVPTEQAFLLREGKDHALFFAVSDYANSGLTDLSQPIKNATDIAGILEQRYGFKTEIVKNPSLAQIRNKLSEYRQKYINGTLPADGQLLIFFSGHGVKDFGAGYFLPTDAKPDDIISTGLPYSTWRGFINDMNCRHILVAVDACYSVTFDPNWTGKGDEDSRFSRKGELSETERLQANHRQYASRLFFTSDSQEDITPGRSNFARKMIEGLANHRGNETFISAEELFASYVKKAQPTPNAGDFGKDDPRSSFLFFYKSTGNIGDTRADRAAYQEAQKQNTITAYRQYIRNYPKGDFKGLAADKIIVFEAEEAELIAWQQAKAQNTHKAYDDFIRAYPNSDYKAVAERRKRNLPVDNVPAHDGLVFVKGGSFQMGSNNGSSDEKPIHRVTVPDFYIGKYEVTQKQWRDVMGSDPEELYNTGCDNCPVERVSWNDIQTFLTKLNQQTGKNYRLPSEAEWEYAARGGQQSKSYTYSGSNTIGNVAWYDGNYKNGNTFGTQKTTRPVGTKKANELGIYDMTGNVWEWCEDDYHDSYNNAPKNGSAWVDSSRASLRVLRGGSWLINAEFCRVAYRGNGNPENGGNSIGFRLAHSL